MVSQQLTNQLIPILKKHGVSHASIFGSYARGEQTAESDLDILVDAPKGITLFGLAAIVVDLEDVIGKKIDIAQYNLLRPAFKDNILKEKIDIL